MRPSAPARARTVKELETKEITSQMVWRPAFGLTLDYAGGPAPGRVQDCFPASCFEIEPSRQGLAVSAVPGTLWNCGERFVSEVLGINQAGSRGDSGRRESDCPAPAGKVEGLPTDEHGGGLKRLNWQC